jgi:hypothetical protein
MFADKEQAMHPDEMNRRHLMTAAAGASLGALISQTAVAQQPAQALRLPFSSKDVGPIHRTALVEISRVLTGTPLQTEAGLLKIVDKLVQSEVITAGEGERIKEIIKHIFSGAALDAILERIKPIYDQLAAGAGDVAAAIANIALDSIAYVKERAAMIDPVEALRIVSADFAGALTAAEASAKFPRWLRIAFVVAGAISASANAAFSRPQ